MAASEGGSTIDTSLPAFIRYGVDSLEAVSLMRAGIPSRSMATAVARDYLAEREKPTQALRPWLCTYDLVDWRNRYHPSPAELRALLEFARAPGTRLASRLLGGETINVPVRRLAETPVRAKVDIREIVGEPPPARLGIWIDAELVAALLPEHVAEIEAVLATGVPLDTTLRASENALSVSIVLVSLFDET